MYSIYYIVVVVYRQTEVALLYIGYIITIFYIPLSAGPYIGCDMLGVMCDMLAPAQNNRVLGAMKWVLWER